MIIILFNLILIKYISLWLKYQKQISTNGEKNQLVFLSFCLALVTKDFTL